MSIKILARCLALLLVTVFFAAPSGGDASGCSWNSGGPSPYGCGGSGGGCYDCLYSGGGGFTQCFENPSGSVAFCTDYQF